MMDRQNTRPSGALLVNLEAISPRQKHCAMRRSHGRRRSASRMQRTGRHATPEGSAHRPVASPSQQAG